MGARFLLSQERRALSPSAARSSLSPPLWGGRLAYDHLANAMAQPVPAAER